jgi:AcrR family transcriptional regulator
MHTVITKPFREITINDITQSASVNRATFYLHYEDKYALLQDCADTLLLEIREEIQFAPDNPADTQPDVLITFHYERIITILEHFRKHRDFYLAMMGKNGDPLFYTLLREGASAWIQGELTTILTYCNMPIDQEHIEMMVRFQSAGNFDVILWWLEQNMHPPIEIMADRLAKITLPPLLKSVNGQA